jgi:hypothetical protein
MSVNGLSSFHHVSKSRIQSSMLVLPKEKVYLVVENRRGIDIYEYGRWLLLNHRHHEAVTRRRFRVVPVAHFTELYLRRRFCVRSQMSPYTQISIGLCVYGKTTTRRVLLFGVEYSGTDAIRFIIACLHL